MAATPKKAVHWNFNEASPSLLNSPFFNGTQDSSMVSTCSLEFINAQMVAHGFAPAPGLSLEGLSNSDSTRVVKCLFGLLSQRMEDMSRTEDLSAKFRTMSYDNERVRSLCRSATERAANAEREMNHHKSRLNATVKSLQASENAHKQTTAELQRTRATLQGIRSTYQMEIKKKDKEIDRITDRWQKISDSQAKISVTPLGIRCANAAVVDGTQPFEQGQGFLELGLEQAETARKHLTEENMGLRKMVVKAVNELHALLHQAKGIRSEEDTDVEPTPFTETMLFPINPPDFANETLNRVVSNLRQTLTILAEPSEENKALAQGSIAEVERLQAVINSLQEELGRATQQAMDQVADARALFDNFAKDQRRVAEDVGEMSIELISGPMQDEEKGRLEALRRELDLERQKFTEATIALGKEKANLEADRIRLLDEKRSWQVELMLAELPPTPSATESPKRRQSPRKSPHKSPFTSPRRSPAKPITVGKVGAPWKTHRSPKLGSSNRVVTYETEVLPPIPPPLSTLKPLAPFTSSLLPTSFTLPPPSPRASLPKAPALPAAEPLSPPESGPSAQNNAIQATPAVRRLFPVAKPFAQGMIHAYSPAKPSPLRVVLTSSQSSTSSTPPRPNRDDLSLSPPSGLIHQETSEELFLPVPSLPSMTRTEPEEEMSLAAQLGVESPPESPLQEADLKPSGAIRAPVFTQQPKKATSSREKGKSRAEPSRSKTPGITEKENTKTRPKASLPPPTTRTDKDKAPAATRRVSPPATNRPTSKPAAVPVEPKPKIVSKPLPTSSTGGARRVLISHSQAPSAKTWKG